MDLFYLKLSDFLTIRFIDCDNILDTTSYHFEKIFSKRRLQYTTKIDEIDKDQFITIILKKKDRINQCINIKNLISFYVSYNYFEMFDNINNYYAKLNIDNDILDFFVKYFTIPVIISQKDGKFIVPSGKYSDLKINIGFSNNLILTQKLDSDIDIQCLGKTITTRSKTIFRKQSSKYFTDKYLLLYLSSTLNLNLRYFIDDWYYLKYLNSVKENFNIQYNNSSLTDILQKLICCALQKHSNDNYYNKYKIFIQHSKIYTNFISDLYNFKSTCKKTNISTSKLLSTFNNLSIPSLSLDFYTSKISYSTWYDNFEIGEIFGSLVHGNFKRNCLQGLEPDIYIKKVNQCVLSSDDYIESQKYYFDNNQYFDDGRKNSSLISFDGIGEGNIFLPIYICEPHFRLVTNNIKFMTSINIYQTPIKFKKKNILLYVSIISELIYNTFCNNQFNTEKWCNILINYILFVKEILKIYYTNLELINLFNLYFNKVKFNTNFVIGLYIILKLNKVDTKLPSINEMILKILEEEIRIQSSRLISSLEIYMSNILDISLEKYFEFLEELKVEHILNKNIIKIWEAELNKKKLLIFVKKIWSFNYFLKNLLDNFDDYISTIENTYGLLDNTQIKNIRKIIVTYKFPEENEIIKGILNPLFDGHKIYNKLIVINLKNIFCKLIPSLSNDNKFENILTAMILQGSLQRNHNKRKIALKKSTLYFNPILYTDICIHNCLKIFIKMWSIKNYKSLCFNLKKKLKSSINIKTIAGIYYILNNNNSLPTVILECIQEGQVKNLKMKLNMLNDNTFVKKKYHWLLPQKMYVLTLLEEEFK